MEKKKRVLKVDLARAEKEGRAGGSTMKFWLFADRGRKSGGPEAEQT